MLSQSKVLLSAVFGNIMSSDSSVTGDMVKNCMLILDGAQSGAGCDVPGRLVLTRKEAADCLGITPRRLDDYTATGRLKRFYMPGARRALGIRRQDVEALLANGAR